MSRASRLFASVASVISLLLCLPGRTSIHVSVLSYDRVREAVVHTACTNSPGLHPRPKPSDDQSSSSSFLYVYVVSPSAVRRPRYAPSAPSRSRVLILLFVQHRHPSFHTASRSPSLVQRTHTDSRLRVSLASYLPSSLLSSSFLPLSSIPWPPVPLLLRFNASPLASRATPSSYIEEPIRA